ncbi:hypothetical protein [Methylocystis echinoides]|uniref:hypothetical protein n=1 Tax=Methylocystis echinoides TaxID=29468 RepID=UPI003421E653
MAPPQPDRIEVVLMADEAQPLRFWVQSTAQLARKLEYGREKSRQILAALAVVLVLAVYLFPAATVMLILLSLIVIFPLALVGMAGFSRG